MILYLIGYMGSGKSTIGRQLAANLGYPFFDLDDYIATLYNRSIPEIFRSDGEATFREMETNALQKLPSTKNGIVSCGGGTFCFARNREWIRQKGVSVYLKVSPEELVNRLMADKNERPILQEHHNDATLLLAFIEQHLSERTPDYEQADLLFEAGGNFNEVMAELSAYFSKYLPPKKDR